MSTSASLRTYAVAVLLSIVAVPMLTRSASADDAAPVSKILAGEIQLKGYISDADPVGAQFVMQALQVQMPQGPAILLSPPRNKSIKVGSTILVLTNGVPTADPNAVLRHGDTILATGPNSGNGETLAARLIVIIDQPMPDSKPASSSPGTGKTK